MPLTLEQYQQHFDYILKLEEKKLEELLHLRSTNSEPYHAVTAEVEKYLTHPDPDIRQATRAAQCYKLIEVDAAKICSEPSKYANKSDLHMTISQLRKSLRDHETFLDLSNCCLWDEGNLILDKTVEAMTEYGFTSIRMLPTVLTKDQFSKILRIPTLKELEVCPVNNIYLWGDLGCKFVNSDNGMEIIDATEAQSLCQYLQQSKLESAYLPYIELFAKDKISTPTKRKSLTNDEVNSLHEIQLQLLCALINAPEMRSLTLSDTGLSHLGTENWQILCDNIQHSKLRSLALWQKDLSTLRDNHWVMFCNSLKNSHLRSLELYRNHRNDLKPIDIDRLFGALEDNYTITEVNLNLEVIPYQLSKLLARNQLIAKIETTLANPYTPDIEPDFDILRDRLEETIKSYDNAAPNDFQSKVKLQTLQAYFNGKFQMNKATYYTQTGDHSAALSAWLNLEPNHECFLEARSRAFELKYSSECDHTHHRASAFIAALPCCLDPDNRLINFGAKEQSLFDTILFAAAGGINPNLILHSATERVALLEYVFLKNYAATTRTPTNAVTFFGSNDKTFLQDTIDRRLASIPVTDIKSHTQTLQALWDEVENDMREGIAVETKNRSHKRERTEEEDDHMLNSLNMISQLSRGNSQVVQHTIKIA